MVVLLQFRAQQPVIRPRFATLDGTTWCFLAVEGEFGASFRISQGLLPDQHCPCLRGLATQWEAREVRGPCGGLLNYPQGFTQGGLHIVDYTATLAQRMRRSTPTSFHVRSWCSPATVSAPTVEP